MSNLRLNVVIHSDKNDNHVLEIYAKDDATLIFHPHSLDAGDEDFADEFEVNKEEFLHLFNTIIKQEPT